jgi:tetratricopeptide (TPR) repeat protein
MLIRLPRCVRVATTVLLILSPAVPLDCLGQAAQKAPENTETTAAHPSVRERLPPFDKLELFGFFAAGPYDSYASQVIQARGTDFTPDAMFIASFSNPVFQEILKNIRPRAARTTSPDRDRAYELLRRAWAAQQNRQFAAASENYRQALQLAPNSPSLHLAYAVDLLFLRNYPAGETQARESLKLWPENAEARASLALSLTAQKQFAEAESESRESLRIFPENHSAMLTLGLTLTHQEKYKEAIPVLQKLIVALPKMPEPRKDLGVSLIKTGEIDEGTSQLRFYVKNMPQDAEAHYYLGVALRSKGSSEEARLQFAEALRLQPDNLQYEVAAHPYATRSATDMTPGPNFGDGSISESVYTNTFFNFTYEFPKGWVSLSSDAARAEIEAGGAFISTGDPTEVDIRKVADRMGHPLLYVVKGGAGNQPISIKSVMVLAVHMGAAPGLTPESFLKSLSKKFKQTRVPMVVNEVPEEITIRGRSFWKATFAAQTAMGSRYTSEFVTADKGYLLMFVVGGQDPTSLREIEKSLESIHFLGTSN